jgi:hypothetical protein
MNSRRASLWFIPFAIYIVFLVWYTNLSGPITEKEMQSYLATMQANGADPSRMDFLRTFMTSDTGNHFIMINILDLNESPPDLPATGPQATAADLINHYMAHMYPAQLARASHPVFFGQAIHDAMDLTGIENAEHWEQGALFRYRSRRDLMDIATDPKFAERHDYKLGALEKTIAFPVQPTLHLSDLRLLLALLLFSLVAFVDLLVYRKG